MYLIDAGCDMMLPFENGNEVRSFVYAVKMRNSCNCNLCLGIQNLADKPPFWIMPSENHLPVRSTEDVL